MIAIQNRQDEGFDSMPRREHMARMGREKAVDNRGDFQASSDAEDQRYMRNGVNLLHGDSHDAHPVVVSSWQHHSGELSHTTTGLSSQENRVLQPSPLNVGFG